MITIGSANIHISPHIDTMKSAYKLFSSVCVMKSDSAIEKNKESISQYPRRTLPPLLNRIYIYFKLQVPLGVKGFSKQLVRVL